MYSKVKGKIIRKSSLRDRWNLLHREKITHDMCTNPQEKIMSKVGEAIWFTLGGRPRSGSIGQLTIRLVGGIDMTIEG